MMRVKIDGPHGHGYYEEIKPISQQVGRYIYIISLFAYFAFCSILMGSLMYYEPPRTTSAFGLYYSYEMMIEIVYIAFIFAAGISRMEGKENVAICKLVNTKTKQIITFTIVTVLFVILSYAIIDAVIPFYTQSGAYTSAERIHYAQFVPVIIRFTALGYFAFAMIYVFLQNKIELENFISKKLIVFIFILSIGIATFLIVTSQYGKHTGNYPLEPMLNFFWPM